MSLLIIEAHARDVVLGTRGNYAAAPSFVSTRSGNKLRRPYAEFASREIAKLLQAFRLNNPTTPCHFNEAQWR
jgi:hypothetical protein